MRVYALQYIPSKDVEIFNKIEKVMEDLSDIKLDEKDDRVVSCHMLARAFEKFFLVKCQDGYYYNKMWSHSWLVTNAGNIIDHYPWGIVGGPLLIINHIFNPAYRLYHKYNLAGLDREEKFILDTQKVIEAMRNVILGESND